MSEEHSPLSQGSIELNDIKQPYYDFEIAKICAWLRAYGYTMHVKLNGSVELRKSDRDLNRCRQDTPRTL